MAYYQTSDGELFYTQEAALKHAKKIGDRQVKEVKAPIVSEKEAKDSVTKKTKK